MTASSTVIRQKDAPPANSVVTAERFAQGIPTFAEWMKAIEKNQETFQRHYDEYEPDMADIAAVKAMVEQSGVKALLIGEDWCPDVWRGLPVLCRIGELTGMEVRLFMRDQHKDIMAEFLNKGEFESVPTIVFYDKNHNYLGHWIERADKANAEMPQIRQAAGMNDVERDTPEWEAARGRYNEQVWEHAEGWRDAQLAEIRALLVEALS